MKLFAPERPEASPGTKALLLDGSAVPWPIIVLNADGSCDIVVNLRNYNANGRSYSQFRHKTDPDSIESFIKNYLADPEDTLEHYFDWSPQATEQMRPAPQRTIAPSALRSTMLGLLE